LRIQRTFVDTNILLYAVSAKDVLKQQISTQAVRSLGSNMVLSNQVLQEFYSVSTAKFGIDPRVARDQVMALAKGEVIHGTPELVEDAIDLSIVTGYSIWDSLIVQAAIQSRCTRILTEDLQHGQVIKGVRVENPFLT